jgi:hypothetical protein
MHDQLVALVILIAALGAFWVIRYRPERPK